MDLGGLSAKQLAGFLAGAFLVIWLMSLAFRK